MNCSNMPYVIRFFTTSIKFFGTFVTQSTFENFPKIRGWGIFSKYFFATKKITRYFCTKETLKNVAYFVHKYVPEMLQKMSQQCTIIHIQNFITFVTFLPPDGIKNFLLGKLHRTRGTSDRFE